MVGDKQSELENIHSETVRVKERGIENYLIADWYRRGAFIDHFLREDATLEGFYRSAYPEQGDYVILPYEADWEVADGTAALHLRRDGHVWVNDQHLPIQVVKSFRLTQGQDRVHVTYTVRNQSDQDMDVRFAVETALAYDGGDNLEYCAFELAGEQYSLADVAAHDDVSVYGAVTRIRDQRVEVTLSQAAHLWCFPLETVTLSEAGFERGYQGTVFLQWWPLHLKPGEAWQVTLTLDVSMLA